MALTRINPDNSQVRERRSSVLGRIRQVAYIAALQRNLSMPLSAWDQASLGLDS
jgi:hypothetical protein